ncbi:nucleobindin-2 [Harmonia axyridis]|uniref:nucleobindin-2 n=1 Tax=Harmonia axyridis TaxID=115357 RepID=UPI001E277174|nr:nucleobindin-2 [Harmonia axyridis]XP_045463172.1 nucleobindin-2 [Harmonia axyridis]
MAQLRSIFIVICVTVTMLQTCYAPPVKEGVKETPETKNQDPGIENYMEYHRYLSEVVQALESDPDFKEKIQKAPEEEIRSGKIADQLEFVSHHVRTKLDEIKRVELERLKELVEKKRKLQGNDDTEDPTHKHIDHANPQTFEIEDLKKLIAKTQEDLAEADKMRREEFKEYEMNKEFEKQKKLNSTNGEDRTKLEKELKEQEEKHKKHEKLHEPGHKAQLEEVWQEQDQMQQEFDPKTFFLLHDMDSNGLWDENEVKALFLKELDKMYQAGAPEDDIRERMEEMERMREQVFREVDSNRDGFIDFQEFIAQTKKQDFNEDHGWNGLDEQKPYTDEELQEYISRHQMNQQQFQQHPPPVQYHQNAPPQAQFHPGQVPQSPPQQVPDRFPDLNTNEIYPPHPNAVPQNNFNKQPQYQQQPNAVPGQHPNQVYSQQNPNPQVVYQQQNQHPNNIQYQQHQANVQYQQPPANPNQQAQNNAANFQQPQGNYQQMNAQGVPTNQVPQHGGVQSNQIPQQNIPPPNNAQQPPMVKQV